MQQGVYKLNIAPVKRKLFFRVTGLVFLVGLFLFQAENAYAQSIINGSFEINTAICSPSGYSRTTLTDSAYDSVVLFSKSFGGALAYGGGTGMYCRGDFPPAGPSINDILPVDGTWMLLATNPDSISLEIQGILIKGRTYRISFYDLGEHWDKSRFSKVQIGISNSPKQFQELIAICDTAKELIWTRREISFVASIDAKYITIAFADDGNRFNDDYVYLDHFQIECSYPYLDFGNDTTICKDATLLLDARQQDTGFVYQWQDGSTDSTYTVTAPGWYWVEITNACGVFRDSIYVAYDSVQAFSIGNDTAFCAASSVTLNSHDTATTYTYRWNNGATSQTITVSSPGKYWLSKTNQHGCSNTDTIQVSMVSPPALELGPDRDTCTGSVVTLDAGVTGMKYLWSTGDTTQSIQVTSFGDYKVRIRSAYCMVEDSIKVSFHQPGVIDLGPDQVACFEDGQTLTLDAGVGSAYNWNTGSTTRYELVTSPGTYWVTVTDPYGCMGSDTVIINQLCGQDDATTLYIPNSFTPNGDGINDVFMVKGYNVKSYHIRIYNRWGERVYESTDLNTGWDGSFRGEPVITAGHIYYIEFMDTTEALHKRSGEVYLLR